MIGLGASQRGGPPGLGLKHAVVVATLLNVNIT